MKFVEKLKFAYSSLNKERLLAEWYRMTGVSIGRACCFQKIKIKTRKTVQIGNYVTIWSGTKLLSHPLRPIVIGDETFINQNCYISSQVTIGNKVSIGPEVMLLSDTHKIGKSQQRAGENSYPEIVIEEGCWLGARVMILGGVRIEKGCVIAAGAVVTKDCKANGLYAGVPARKIRDLGND